MAKRASTPASWTAAWSRATEAATGRSFAPVICRLRRSFLGGGVSKPRPSFHRSAQKRCSKKCKCRGSAKIASSILHRSSREGCRRLLLLRASCLPRTGSTAVEQGICTNDERWGYGGLEGEGPGNLQPSVQWGRLRSRGAAQRTRRLRARVDHYGKPRRRQGGCREVARRPARSSRGRRYDQRGRERPRTGGLPRRRNPGHLTGGNRQRPRRDLGYTRGSRRGRGRVAPEPGEDPRCGPGPFRNGRRAVLHQRGDRWDGGGGLRRRRRRDEGPVGEAVVSSGLARGSPRVRGEGGHANVGRCEAQTSRGQPGDRQLPLRRKRLVRGA